LLWDFGDSAEAFAKANRGVTTTIDGGLSASSTAEVLPDHGDRAAGIVFAFDHGVVIPSSPALPPSRLRRGRRRGETPARRLRLRPGGWRVLRRTTAPSRFVASWRWR